MTARLAGGVNLNYIRFHSHFDHQTTLGDNLTYPFKDNWVMGIEQGGFEAQSKVGLCTLQFRGHSITEAYQLSILHSQN
jgi:hypothetical protein